MSKWMGESESMIRSVFQAAKQDQPSLLFMDELDALTFQRSSHDELNSRRVISELLIQV